MHPPANPDDPPTDTSATRPIADGAAAAAAASAGLDLATDELGTRPSLRLRMVWVRDDPAGEEPAAEQTPLAPAPAESDRPRGRRTGTLWFGIAAVVLALIGQQFLAPGGRPPGFGAIVTATAWYVAAVAVLVLGWGGSYTNGPLEHIPRPAVTTIPVRWAGRGRPRAVAGLLRRAGALGALSANIWALRLLRSDWTDWAALLLWVASLAGLLLVTLGERPAPGPPPRTPAGPAGEAARSLPRWAEAAVLLAILGLALALRLWRLGELAPGMHGDEGEAGAAALGILHGALVSPFTPGWSNQTNFYYWAIALSLKLGGTGLVGLRAPAVLCGLATVGFVYGCAREMFGLRAAIIAGLLVAFGSADILLSRLEFSAATLPLFMAAAFYCLVRGLRGRRHVYFVLAGLAAGGAGYFFAAGWLVPVAAGALLAYLALARRGFLAVYGSRVAAFALALAMIGAPFWLYFADHPIPADTYPNGIFIWSHYDQLAALYGDDNWAAVLGDQLTRTLSILTFRPDASALGILDYPVALPIEAALLVLGLAWAAWRWRDTRFALISLWFWVAVSLGVLTTDAPNLPRLAGMLPVLALAIAAVLDHLAAQVPRVTTDFGRLPHLGPAGRRLGALVVAGTLAIAGLQHGQLFFADYLNSHQTPDVTAQAAVVAATGPGIRYYDLGAPQISWTHGDNRFLNPAASGADLANVPNDLPLTDNGPNADQPAVFLVWDTMRDYLPVLQTYYPEGSSDTVPLGDTRRDTPPLITYSLSAAQIDAHRVLQARYAPAAGPAVARVESRIGLTADLTPPKGLPYPAAATWQGAVIAPAYGTYRWQLAAPAGSRLAIDGADVLTATLAGGRAQASVVLARGAHTIRLAAPLPDARTRVDLLWAVPGGTLMHVPRRYLWDNHAGSGWQGAIGPVDPLDPLGVDPGLLGGSRRLAAVSTRVDGFLGFRDAGRAFGASGALSGVWTTTLAVAATGTYGFDLRSNGDSILSVDGQEVVTNTEAGRQAHRAAGQIALGLGPHTVTVRYIWLGGTGVLECGWTPPGHPRALLLPP